MAAIQLGKPANIAPEQQDMEMGKQLQDLQALIGSLDTLYIHQKVGLLEAVSQGCCEQQNQYKIFNGDDKHILSARESSSGCTRYCCAPHHSTMIFIEDANTQNTLISIERQGLQFPCPLKCLGCCCILTDYCKDGITIYEGKVEGDPGDLQNAPTPIASLKQATCGGGIWPKMESFPKGNEDGDASHRLSGPCIFGGCSELCMKSTYKYTTSGGKDKGEIVHLTPKTIGDACREICTDTDKFSVSFDQSANMTERATLLSGAFLIDYIFFEMDNGMISCKNCNQIDITFCFCHCFGCILPLKLRLKRGQGGGGEGPSGDTEYSSTRMFRWSRRRIAPLSLQGGCGCWH